MEPSGENVVPEGVSLQLSDQHDNRVHFSGPPRSLSGTLPLVNPGADKQKIKTFAVNAEELKGAAGLPIREFPIHARLYGGQQARVPATIELDPRTEPGTYDFEISIGGKTMPATASVSPVVDLNIDPKRVTILAGSTTSHVRTITVENAGNVPLILGTQCEVDLFDSYDLIGSLITGLHKSDQDSVDSMVKGFLKEWAGLKAGTMTVKRPATTVSPGQKVALDVEFQVPSDLKPLKRYRAALQLYNAGLTVDIYTSANMGSQDDPAPEQPEQVQPSSKRSRKGER